MQEIIAKIREILLSFEQKYRNLALSPERETPTIPNIDDPNFLSFFENLSESYA